MQAHRKLIADNQIHHMAELTKKSAVLFLVFNRLGTTKRVFSKIRDYQPPRLYISSDGPRENQAHEKSKVKEVREFILSNIDWDCQILTLNNESNLGCKIAVSKGITWFFENEEMGIILEDDCLPSPYFFRYCDQLLEKYQTNDNIGAISGFNPFPTQSVESYKFINYAMVWGWASWRRSWDNYDPGLKDIHNIDQLKVLDASHWRVRKFWKRILDKIGAIDTWDYQLSLTLVWKNQMCIIPKTNLIDNIGYGQDATHTVELRDSHNPPVKALEFPLIHPSKIEVDFQTQQKIEFLDYYYPNLLVRGANFLRRKLKF